MANPPRKVANILAATEYGPMIVNRFDYHASPDSKAAYGVGFQLLETGYFDPNDSDFLKALLMKRRQMHGDGVVAIDGGANIGTLAVAWAKLMWGWGEVHAIEAQERIYYSLAGNIALNNCFNARAIWAAIGLDDEINVPMLDYFQPSSYGSLELRQTEHSEFIGQKVNAAVATPTRCITIDSLELPRLDLLKLDIEGMEMEGLASAIRTIRTFRPYCFVERIKVDPQELSRFFLEEDYEVRGDGMNMLAVPAGDPLLEKLPKPQVTA
jgi:FkbM family methyltransferase